MSSRYKFTSDTEDEILKFSNSIFWIYFCCLFIRSVCLPLWIWIWINVWQYWSFYRGNERSKKYRNVFGITTETGLFTTIAPTEMSATSTDCRWMLARIEQFFDESYPKIAEESAQGQGPHLEALAALVGCNARQTVLLEKAMQQNYQNVFDEDDIDHAISEFYTVVNSDEQLAACWPKS